MLVPRIRTQYWSRDLLGCDAV